MAYAEFESDGITVASSTDTADQLASTLTPEPAVDAVAEPDETAEPVVEKPKKPRDDPKARMLDATAKEAAAKRERDDVKAENERLKLELAAAKAPKVEAPRPQPVPVSTAADDPEPTVEKFETYEKFVKAQARWEARQEIRQQELERHRHTVQQQEEYDHREVNEAFYDRYGKILADEPDYPKKLFPSLINAVRYGMLSAEDKKTASSASVIMEEVFHSENPRALLDYVVDPANSQRLATLPPTKLRRELARVEFGAASPSAPAPAAPISHAKPPIKPVSSSPHAADANEITDDLSVDEHIKRMNAKDRAARRAS